MSLRFVYTLLFIFSISACSNTNDEYTNDNNGNENTNATLNQKPDGDRVSGEVVSVSSDGLELATDEGVTLSVVFGDNLVLDNQGTTQSLTDIGVGDFINVQGTLDSDNSTIDALKIEVDGTDLDNNEADSKVVMVVGAGLTRPVAQTEVEVEDDNYVSVRGTVASVEDNDVVVDIDSVDNSDQDLGDQISVSLSDDFIKLGSLSDITVGANVELKGGLSDTDQFSIRVLKVETAATESTETAEDINDKDQVTTNDGDESTLVSDQGDSDEGVDANSTDVDSSEDSETNDVDSLNTGSFDRFNRQRSGGMTTSAAVNGVVTSVTTDAIMLTVTSVEGANDIVPQSNITIMVDTSTQFDNGTTPVAGDNVTIEIGITMGGGRVASEVTVI